MGLYEAFKHDFILDHLDVESEQIRKNFASNTKNKTIYWVSTSIISINEMKWLLFQFDTTKYFLVRKFYSSLFVLQHISHHYVFIDKTQSFYVI